MRLPVTTSRLSSLTLAILVSVPLFGACDGDDGDIPPPVVDEIDPPGPATLASVGAGAFYPLGDYQNIYGHAQVVRALDGTSTFEVSVEGLSPGLDYPVHVHALPCEVDNAGGHYKIDPTVPDTQEANEIWPVFTTDENGNGRGSVTANHLARMDAQSIVVHDPEMANAKMACANLWVPPLEMTELHRSGDMAPFAAAEAIDQNIAGTARMVTSAAGSTVTLSLQGLDPAEEYRAHVHALPCEVNDAGGHYKLDPTVVDTVDTNELWPDVTVEADGSVETEITSPHEARGDAQSVVIHRVFPDATTPKVACANLARAGGIELQTTGTAQALADGVDRYPDLGGSATMYRRLDGSTAARMLVEGLTPGQEYVAHIHEYTCNTADGGGHYKFDTTVADPIEENEIWIRAQIDAEGAGEGTVLVAHMARPDAQSIVLHDHEDNARLFCLDLD